MSVKKGGGIMENIHADNKELKLIMAQQKSETLQFQIVRIPPQDQSR
jgi:hypothetical protein